MKILMASHYFASHKGGIEIAAEELYRELTAKDQEVVWLAANATPLPDPIGRSRPVSLPIFNFVEEKTGLPFPISSPSALRRISRELRSAAAQGGSMSTGIPSVASQSKTPPFRPAGTRRR